MNHSMASEYMAHGFCFSWEPHLVWLHVASDILTGVTCYAIAFAMTYFIFKRRNEPYALLLLLFALFILACGTTHFFAAYTIYVPDYWPEGYVKAFTTAISVITAILFIPKIPAAIEMPSISKTLNDLQLVSAEQRRTEKELQLKVTELERFTYTVSHDLKSPLITIQSYADMISQEMEAGNHARAQEDLKRVRNAASKMTHLLDDLLRLSRVGRKMNPPVQVNMNQVAKYVLSQLASPIRLRQVEFVEQSELPAVRGDQHRIEEVLQNLVENAIKYMGDQPKPFIEIGAREEQGKHVFFVQDNGIGIDKRYHETIFGLFNKLDAKNEGTGIGLALVKQIIEMHGGRVWVESEGVGKGSRFCFTIGQNLVEE